MLQGKCCSSWNPLPWLKMEGKGLCRGFLLFVDFLHFVLDFFLGGGGGGVCNLASPCIYFFLLLFFAFLSPLSEANSVAGWQVRSCYRHCCFRHIYSAGNKKFLEVLLLGRETENRFCTNQL